MFTAPRSRLAGSHLSKRANEDGRLFAMFRNIHRMLICTFALLSTLKNSASRRREDARALARDKILRGDKKSIRVTRFNERYCTSFQLQRH